MFTRRRLLRDAGIAIGLSASVATAGCLFSTSAGSSREFTSELTDTSPTPTPSFLTAYTCDPSALREALGGDEVLPDIAVAFLSNVRANVSGTSIDDLDRLTGQYGQNGGHGGGDLMVIRPSASHLVATGSIDVDAVAAWLSDRDGVSDLGSERGYRSYGTDGTISEAFVVDGSAFGYGNRDGLDVDPGAIAADAIDAMESDAGDGGASSGDGDAAQGRGLRDYASELFAVVDVLEGDTLRFATQFDLIAERPDTGTAAYDDLAASVVAAGVGASVGDGSVDVHRVLRYRIGRAPAVETVEAGLERASDDDGPLAGADWSVSRDGRTVSTTATVDTEQLREQPAALRTAFPIAAYEDVTGPIDPQTLGRAAAPRANWQPSLLDDGRIQIVHGGGSDVEDLVVQYEADGSAVEERWDGPVASDDEFETDRAPDPGTLFDLVWSPETADETILMRIELPASS